MLIDLECNYFLKEYADTIRKLTNETQPPLRARYHRHYKKRELSHIHSYLVHVNRVGANGVILRHIERCKDDCKRY